MSTDSFPNSRRNIESVRFDVFDGLANDEIQSIIGATTNKVFSSGETLCRQGEDGQSMYFLE